MKTYLVTGADGTWRQLFTADTDEDARRGAEAAGLDPDRIQVLPDEFDLRQGFVIPYAEAPNPRLPGWEELHAQQLLPPDVPASEAFPPPLQS